MTGLYPPVVSPSSGPAIADLEQEIRLRKRLAERAMDLSPGYDSLISMYVDAAVVLTEDLEDLIRMHARTKAA